jgi:hypothetical protein
MKRLASSLIILVTLPLALYEYYFIPLYVFIAPLKFYLQGYEGFRWVLWAIPVALLIYPAVSQTLIIFLLSYLVGGLTSRYNIVIGALVLSAAQVLVCFHRVFEHMLLGINPLAPLTIAVLLMMWRSLLNSNSSANIDPALIWYVLSNENFVLKLATSLLHIAIITLLAIILQRSIAKLKEVSYLDLIISIYLWLILPLKLLVYAVYVFLIYWFWVVGGD